MSELLSILAVLISCAACLIVWRRSSSAPSQGLPPVLGELKKKLNFNFPPHVSQYRDEDALGPTNHPSQAPDFGTSSPHKPQLPFLTTRRKIWASIGIIGAAALACTIFIPVNNQIADHRAEFFAAFEGQVQSCFNGEHDNATTCNDLPSKRESMQSALSPLKKNPEPLSKKVELPLNVFGLKLLWEVSVLDTVNGPACLCDGLQEMDECRAIELIMQGQDYADLRSDLSIANMSTGWASDIHKKLLALLWQGNHIRTEPAPCPNCRAFINQLSEGWCEKMVVTAMGKEQFVESFNRAASKRNEQSKSNATSDVTQHFQSRIQNLRGTSHVEAKKLLQDARAVTLGKRLVTTRTSLGNLIHEVPEWTPNFDWVDKELGRLERNQVTRSNPDDAFGQRNDVTLEMDDCYTRHRANRPWANIYPKVGICGGLDFEQIQVATLPGEEALFVIASDNGEIINHRLLRSNSSAMMRVGPANYYTVFIIHGNDFKYNRQVPGQTNKLDGFFSDFEVMMTRVYVGTHGNRQFSTASSRMNPSNLRAVFN